MGITITNSRFYSAAEVSSILGISTTSAYRIIKRLNDELKDQGFITVPGKIGKTYFESKIMM